jgi:hypothetical protein
MQNLHLLYHHHIFHIPSRNRSFVTAIRRKKKRKKHRVHAAATGITFYKTGPQQKSEFSEDSHTKFQCPCIAPTHNYYHPGFIGGKDIKIKSQA